MDWQGEPHRGQAYRATARISERVMAAFTAKGEAAEWRLIYEAIREMAVGEVIRYDALDEVLGRSFTDEGAKRNPLERARRELEEVDHRTLATVRGVGYRVVEAREHMVLARGHQIRSARQTKRAKEKLDSANLAALTDLERRRHEEMSTQVAKLLSEQRRTNRRLADLERLLDTVRKPTTDPPMAGPGGP